MDKDATNTPRTPHVLRKNQRLASYEQVFSIYESSFSEEPSSSQTLVEGSQSFEEPPASQTFTLVEGSQGSGCFMEGASDNETIAEGSGVSMVETCGDGGTADIRNPTHTTPCFTPKPRAKKKSTAEKVDSILALMKAESLSPFDFLEYILNENNEAYRAYRLPLYKQKSECLNTLFDSIACSKEGGQKLRAWIQWGPGLELVTDIITDEMDALKTLTQKKGLAEINPEYIKGRITVDFEAEVPFTLHLLRSAAESKRQHEHNTVKTPEQICTIIIQQLLYQRSNKCFCFAGEFGIFLWATGASRRTIDVLHSCRLCPGYQSILDCLRTLGKHNMEVAKAIADKPHILVYDNVNISASVSIEQLGDATRGRVTSGTLGLLLKIPTARPEDMLLAPILARRKEASINGLSFEMDLIPTDEQYASFLFQLQIHVIKIPIAHCDHFKKYESYSNLQYRPRRPQSLEHKPEFCTLRVSTTEEASTSGNIKYHDEIYLSLLQKKAVDLSKYAIPTINDQLTNSRIRSSQILRAADINPFNCRLDFQVGIGLFHLCLNLSWALLSVHRGTKEQKGSLAYFFSLSGKSRLSGEKPDYHSLIMSFTEIIEGLVLNGLQTLCAWKKETLTSFAGKNPSSEDLLQLATDFLEGFATPLPSLYSQDKIDSTSSKSKKSVAVPPTTQLNTIDPEHDKVNQNMRLLTRDLLIFCELVYAIRDGDFGRIEDILPQLAMMFREAGGNNYCTEILHLILNLKYVWTPDFANIMRDSHLINISGFPGHWMAMDLNMEHTVRAIKELLHLKGRENSWDMLADASASVNDIERIKKKIAKIMDCSHQSRGHFKPNIQSLVWEVAKKVKEEQFQVFTENQRGNSSVLRIPDLIEVGAQKLKSSTLGTFNAKFKNCVDGQTGNGVSQFLETDTLGSATDNILISEEDFD